MTIIELLARHAYRHHPEGIALASGQVATEYIDCRAALGHADVLGEAAEAVGVARNDVDAIGGIAMGGIAIAAAVSVRSRRFITAVPWFYIRDSRKSHGLGNVIEGAVGPGDTVCLVEDVVTTGESVITAALACQQYGLRVMQVLALVDREQSGMDRIRDLLGSKVSVAALCTLSEIRACARRGAAG